MVRTSSFQCRGSGELRSHKSCSMDEKKKRKEEKINSRFSVYSTDFAAL